MILEATAKAAPLGAAPTTGEAAEVTESRENIEIANI